jgi:transcriptional regulator with PAS, ATPase and Fis domain
MKKGIEKETLIRKSQMYQYLGSEEIIGDSPSMRELFEIIKRSAESNSNVLISGESGTGKEMVAREIHRKSSWSRGPFSVINCGAIPESLLESELFGHEKGAFTGAYVQRNGKIELAQGGTLLLDEIGELPLSLQVKLLRFLEDRTIERIGGRKSIYVDIRVIAATNKELNKAIKEGSFREDLYYRLNVIPIHLPRLIDRIEDIPLLVYHFIEKYKRRITNRNVSISSVSPEAMKILMNYTYPGNVRELENAIEYAIAFISDIEGNHTIKHEDLPKHIQENGRAEDCLSLMLAEQRTPMVPLKEAKFRFEKRFITSTLIACKGNISKTAKTLRIHRQNLQQKIKLFGIDMKTIFIRDLDRRRH